MQLSREKILIRTKMDANTVFGEDLVPHVSVQTSISPVTKILCKPRQTADGAIIVISDGEEVLPDE
jgi:hypothetical protein